MIKALLEKLKTKYPDEYCTINIEFHSHIRLDGSRNEYNIYSVYVNDAINEEFESFTALEKYIGCIVSSEERDSVDVERRLNEYIKNL